MSESTAPKYIIDTSFFIQAYRNYYAFDIAPSFWENIIKMTADNVILSIDKVFDELAKGKDELHDWALLELDQFFSPTDTPEILNIYQDLMNWAQSSNQYNDNAKIEFAEFDNADSWVLAFAIANNLTVVSQEVFDAGIKRKIPIPNVCADFNVKHIDTFTFLREIGFRM